MRALLTLWWWRWVTSAHDRLHVDRDVLWENYWWNTPTTTEADSTVTYESDDG